MRSIDKTANRFIGIFFQSRNIIYRDFIGHKKELNQGEHGEHGGLMELNLPVIPVFPVVQFFSLILAFSSHKPPPSFITSVA